MNPDEMVKEVNARFVELKKMEQECIAAIQTKQADLNAILGAQQDCQFWLGKITAMEAEKTTPEFTPDTKGGEAPPKFSSPLVDNQEDELASEAVN
jgi:hypothetical protein